MTRPPDMSKELQKKKTPFFFFFSLVSQTSLVLQVIFLLSPEPVLPSSASMKHLQPEIHMKLLLSEEQTPSF